MLIYFLYYIFIIGLGYMCLSKNSSEKSKKTFCILSGLAMILLLGLRHPSMGNDLGYYRGYGYLSGFKYISQLSWNQVFTFHYQNYERLYIIFNKLVGYIGTGNNVLLMCCAVFSITPIFSMIYKRSEYPLLSIITYLGLPCFLINFSGLRQSIAIGLVCFSLEFIQNKKLVKFILTIMLAGLFHSSAFVFLVAYPLFYLKYSKVRKYLGLIIIAVVYIFRSKFFTIFSKIFKNEATPDNNGAVTLFIVFVLIYIFLLIFGNSCNEIENGLRNIFWFACVCQAFGGVYQLSLRVGYYFMLSLVFLLPLTISDRFKKTNSANKTDGIIIYSVAFICFMAYGLFSLYDSSWTMSYPYHAFF